MAPTCTAWPVRMSQHLNELSHAPLISSPELASNRRKRTGAWCWGRGDGGVGRDCGRTRQRGGGLTPASTCGVGLSGANILMLLSAPALSTREPSWAAESRELGCRRRTRGGAHQRPQHVEDGRAVVQLHLLRAHGLRRRSIDLRVPDADLRGGASSREQRDHAGGAGRRPAATAPCRCVCACCALDTKRRSAPMGRGARPSECRAEGAGSSRGHDRLAGGRVAHLVVPAAPGQHVGVGRECEGLNPVRHEQGRVARERQVWLAGRRGCGRRGRHGHGRCGRGRGPESKPSGGSRSHGRHAEVEAAGGSRAAEVERHDLRVCVRMIGAVVAD